jgi:protein-tyrosine phosphatase
MTQPPVTSILFVCMGNICRSPLAEGAFRKLWRERVPQLELHIDSAGTHAYHIGEPPDERAVAVTRLRGMDISMHRGRRVTRSDFAAFDYILAMDRANLAGLHRLQAGQGRANVHLLLEFANAGAGDEVPDPYYGGPHGFEQVLDLVTLGAEGLLRHLCQSMDNALRREGSES